MRFSTPLYDPADAGGAGGGGSGDAPPAAPVTFAGVLGEDGAFAENWHSRLPEELQPTAQNYRSLPDMAKALRESKQALSKRVEGMVKVPGEGATAEELAAWRKAIGVPDDVAGYGITKPEALPEGVEWNEAEAAAFAAKAHELGLPPSAVKQLLEWQTNQLGAKAEASRKDLQDLMAQEQEHLRKEWSASKYDATRALAEQAAKAHGFTDDDIATMSVTDWKAWAAVGAKFSESGLVQGGRPAGGALRDLSNPAHPDHVKWLTGDPALVRQQQQFLESGT